MLQLARTYGQRFFLHFGLHCATHQIRVILISCVIITSLFYPALALYSKSASFRLDNIWSPYSSILAIHDHATCGSGRLVRVERILIPTMPEDDADVLLSTLAFQARVQELLMEREVSCIRQPHSSRKCLVISPLSYWEYSTQAILTNPDVLSANSIIQVDGISVHSSMVLATKRDSDIYLALTFFFPTSDCSSLTDRVVWEQVVRDAVPSEARVDLQFSAAQPAVLALSVCHTDRIGSRSRTYLV
jgi:hypothetical protein